MNKTISYAVGVHKWSLSRVETISYEDGTTTQSSEVVATFNAAEKHLADALVIALGNTNEGS